MKLLEKLAKKQNDLVGEPPVTVAFLGDSVTQGCFECYRTGEKSIETVFDPENSFPRKFCRMLNTLYPNVQINIVNSGISGDSAPGGLARIDRDILRFCPDLVVVGFALNDATAGKDSLAVYEEAMRGILGKIRASGAECIVLTPNMMNTEVSVHLTDPLFRGIAENCAGLQNTGVLDLYADAARRVAAEEGAVVCDVYKKWETMASAGVRVTELLANKTNHPIRAFNEMTAFMLCECVFEA